MNEIMIPLDNIQPNPFQPRMSEDEEHILALADSILRDGLLQIPVGRNVSGLISELNVQLAFGHSRLAAYRVLADLGRNEFRQMPVSIKALTDQQMFEYAVTENVTRKNLTPIEEATAMQRYRDEFGKTSVEIGALFGVNDSTVRNKLRLLNLPESVQENIKAGQIGEASARRLLAFQRVRPGNAVDEVAAEAIRQELSPKETESVIARKLALDPNAQEMWSRYRKDQPPRGGDGLWPLDWEPAQSGMVCTACPQHLRLNDTHYCCNKECWTKKRREWSQEELARLSDEMGIPAYSAKIDGKKIIKPDWETRQAFREWFEEKDAGLRLQIFYDSYSSHDHTGSRCVRLVSVNADYLVKEEAKKAAKAKRAAEYSWEAQHKKRQQSNEIIRIASQHFSLLMGAPSDTPDDSLIISMIQRVNRRFGNEIEIPEDAHKKTVLCQELLAQDLLDWLLRETGLDDLSKRIVELAEAWGVWLPGNWDEMVWNIVEGEADGSD